MLGDVKIDPAAFEKLITFTDDEQCKAILADVGVTTVTEKPPFTKSTSFFNWNNHRAMAFYEYGHPLPADNGYTIVMLPFSIMSKPGPSFRTHHQTHRSQLVPRNPPPKPSLT